MSAKRYGLYLAALLHDIGKMYQRAEQASVATRESFRFSSRFIREKESKIRRWIEANGWQSLLTVDLIHAWATALPPQESSEASFIAQAASLAGSGMSSYPQVRPVLETVMCGQQPGKQFLPLTSLSLEKEMFTAAPVPTQADYRQLWQAFSADFDNLPSTHLHENLLTLLHVYAGNVPSGTAQEDVPLYDYIRSTAAIALCLYDAQEASVQEPQFLLVGGAISGIQGYLYDIVSKHAAKNLKGRSYYIQLLVDTVVEYLLKALNLPHGNIVYASGGGFYLLVANTPKHLETLEQTQKTISANLLAQHQTALALSLYWEPVPTASLTGDALSVAWATLHTRLDRQKYSRFSAMLTDQFDYFFNPEKNPDQGGNTVRDAITGEEITGKGRELDTILPGTTEKQQISSFTDRQISLGKDLKENEIRVVYFHETGKARSPQDLEPAKLGVFHAFLDADRAEKIRESDTNLLFAPNRTSAKALFPVNRQGIVLTDFYGGNNFPANQDGEPVTFNVLAGAPDDSEIAEFRDRQMALKRLGVLRMDVDNLGRCFALGFQQQAITLARYSTLSRSLDWFFKGYLNTLWKQGSLTRDDETFAYKDHTSIVYSGGDDLFIVGRWDVTLAFAAEIAREFRLYVQGNPHLTLSGGMAMVSPKFPLSKGAALAAEAEHQAKEHTCFSKGLPPVGKNAFSLLGVPLNWDHEFNQVQTLKDSITGLIRGSGDNERLAMSLIRKIGQHHAAFITWKQDPDNHVERWRWQMAYDFSRLSGPLKQNHPEAAAFIQEQALNAFTWDDKHNLPDPDREGHFLNHTYLELLNLAARWAELEMRTTATA